MKFFPRTYDLFDDVFDDMFNTPFFTGRNNGLMRTDITEKMIITCWMLNCQDVKKKTFKLA